MRRLVLGLNAATVLLVLGGILLLVLPSPSPSAKAPAVVSFAAGTTEDVRQPAADVGAADRVVRTNVFSPRRAAPSRRYSFGDPPPEPELGVDAGLAVASEGVSMTMDSATASTAADVVPHLYGTMLGPADSTALLRLDARVNEPRLFRVGDRAGGYRVVGISDRAVTLMGPTGRVVLRLPRPEQ
jgi:hypothetical protein